jgi:serine/threonine-protein kinase
MATVYRATAPDGNLVAIKVLAMHLAADPTARLRFEQESNLGLNHPHIVRVMNCGVLNGAPYIVMDYVVGESLDRRLTRGGSLAPAQFAPILRDAARALDYAHGRSVIHRDVKPSNILIRTDGKALLADFGVAKSASLTAYTATTARVGSVFYMSPEQADGTLEITPASDIYSLGITAYYALTGRHPFEAENEIAIARMHIDAKPRHISEVNPALPRSVGNVIMQALEKDPTRRPSSAGAFAQAFEQALLATGQPRRTIRRLPPVLVTAAALACTMPVLGFALTSIVTAQLNSAEAARTPTLTPLAAQVLLALPNPALTLTLSAPSATSLATGTTANTAPAADTATLAPTSTPQPAPIVAPVSNPTRRPPALPTATRRVVIPAPTSTRRPPPSPTPVRTVVVTVAPPTLAPTETPVLPTAPPPTAAPTPVRTVVVTDAPPTSAPPTEPPVPPTAPPPTTAPPQPPAPTTVPLATSAPGPGPDPNTPIAPQATP